MKPLLLVSLITLGAAAAVACGGQVVFEEPNDGGAGGSGTSGSTGTKSTTGTKGTTNATNGTNATNATNNQVTSVSSSVATTSGGCSVNAMDPVACGDACQILYQCGQTFCGGPEQQCPAFTPNNISMDQFVMFCIPQCQNIPALIQLVEPTDCAATIQTFNGASPEFNQLCQGFEG